MIGEYTTDEAPGAWKNGTRVRKAFQEARDAHRDGALATVLGSIPITKAPPGRPPLDPPLGYFVEWDDTPGVACFIVAPRLKLAETDD